MHHCMDCKQTITVGSFRWSGALWEHRCPTRPAADFSTSILWEPRS